MRALAAVLVLTGIAAAVAVAGGGASTPTFHGQVDRILRRHCDECHHAGDIAPMALDDPATAQSWSASIVAEVEAGRMPPWRPSRGVGKFVDERGLTPKELDVLRRWRDVGAPLGRPPAKTKPVASPSDWVLGTPDEVLDYGEAFTVSAGGDDVYRCFPIRNPFGRDVWIAGVDVRPGDRRVLHHVVMYIDGTTESATLDAADPGPGYDCFGGTGTSSSSLLGGWAPGNRPHLSPRGTAMRLAANDTVVVQCHYHPLSEHEMPGHTTPGDVADRTTIGLYLSPDPAPTEIFLLPVMNDTFTIPAGDSAYPVEAVLDPSALTGGLFEVSGHVLAVMPHMHWLGKSIQVDLQLPDGTEQRLVEIPDWSFDWQDTYTMASAVPVPGRTKIRLSAVYDNSAGNPENPNSPPKDVSHGERTVDEMCLAFLAITIGPATADAPPTVRSVTIDRAGRLVVAAKNLGRGGRIEIGGVPVSDSAASGPNRLRSAADWNTVLPSAGPASIRVRRTDGRLSLPFTYSR